ncbi:hypothetical protein TNIN_6801 [Trichonephila inaurata madagascariensis]|uniref:Transposase n=1 Tax=Trichonephila inaurata madagascariensis TaxID=2747483 RepID=A0A8X6Y0H7_9ARAC|nr:hypothetical protein TNIN_6801 [Trichonephila inaurata madagascariensis]
MCTALGATVVSYDTVKIWNRKFKNKDQNIQQAEQSGQTSDVEEEHLSELVEEMLCIQPRKELDVPLISVSRVLHHINLTYKFKQ